ncbi:MAG: Crp/Fnr family transcriptional regulator [Cardiobacteriaceae bacterium]|nr:Crp/Fnr family transcriptional regulator [Cardiobacteriaceae bacterium]
MNLPIEQILESHYLFSPLDKEQKQEIMRYSKVRDYQAGNLIFAKNETVQAFYVVLEGSVRLFFSTPDGKEKTIKTFHPPQTFAEALMFLQRDTYPANAMALETTKLLAINSKRFAELLLSHPPLCLTIMGSLSSHVHTLSQQVEMLSVFDARTRLLNYLTLLLPPAPQKHRAYPLSMSKKQIAEYLAIRPETLSRLLKQLELDGYFTWQGSSIHLLNWNGEAI